MRRALLLTALFLLVGASAAQAAPTTVSVTGGPVLTTLTVQDDDNTNTMTVSSPGFGTFVVEDTTATLTPGTLCGLVNNDPHKVSCSDPRIANLHIDVSRGPDTVTNKTSTPAEIWGGSNKDVLTGGSGDDQIDGAYSCDASEGPRQCGYFDNGAPVGDTLNGGAGNDTLKALAGGGDTLNGGTGTDVLDANAAVPDASSGGCSWCTSGQDVLDGGANGDTLQSSVNPYGTAVVADYSARSSAVTVILDGNANDGAAGENDNVMPSVNRVIGGSAGDSLSAGTGGAILEGRGGADSLTGGPGGDTLIPGAGSGDNVAGGGGTDTATYEDHSSAVSLSLDGTANDGEAGENDNLTGVENLVGGPSGDTLIGDGGANGLDGRDGADILKGGAGPDVFTGGNGRDTLDFSDHSAGIQSSANGVADDGSPGEGDFVSGDIEQVIGTAGNDVMSGTGGADYFAAGDGNDDLDGGGGDDILEGGPGDDTLHGSDGADALDAGTGNDSLWGGPGNDGEDGGDGNDTLHGEAGNDTLHGGNGNDTLSGELGADALDGGAGSDTADYSTPVATSQTDCSESDGCVEAPVSADGVNVDLAAGTATMHAQWDACDHSLGFWFCSTPSETSSDTLTGLENAVGTPGSDTIKGTSARNVISAGDGDDSVDGRGSIESADALDGGNGTDTADFSTPSGQSLVIDLATGAVTRKACQTLICGGLTSQAAATGFENAIGTDYADTLRGTSGPNTLDGGAGGDLITGFAGADNLIGGAGDDNIQARDSSADTVSCGTNNDTAAVDPLDTPSNCETVQVGQPPTAGFNQSPGSPLTNQSVTFTSTSVDPDGSIVTIEWDLDNDGQYDDATGPTASRSFANNGSFTVGIRVTDNDGQVATQSHAINVANRPPVAEFGFSPTTPGVGQDVAFTSSSSDPDGSVTAQAWDLDNDGQYDDATGPTASRTFTTAGAHPVGLRVTDDDGVSTTVTHVVNVKSPPVAAFGFSPPSPLTGQSVSFSSTSSDADGPLTLQEWDLDNDGQYDDGTGATANRTFADSGPQTVGLRVTDSDGLTATVSHTVTVLNRPPVAAFSSAPLAPRAGDSVTFTSSSSDPDGSVATQEWDLDDDGQYDDATGASASRSFPSVGTYTIGLRVTDDDGAPATIAHTVTIAPAPAPDPGPVPTPGANSGSGPGSAATAQQPAPQGPAPGDTVRQAAAHLLGANAVDAGLGLGDVATALTQPGPVPYSGGPVLDPKLAVGCLTDACVITGTATLGGVKGASAAGTVTLKVKLLKLAHGQAGLVKLSVPPAARKALKRAKKPKLVLKLTVAAGGQKKTATHTYRLKQKRQ